MTINADKLQVKKNSLDYWAKRAAREHQQQLIPVEQTADELAKLYAEASREIEEKARRLVRRFQLKNQLTAKEADALLNTIKSPDDINALIQALKANPNSQKTAAELESQAYGARINRLQAVQTSVDAVTTALLSTVAPTMTETLTSIANGAYYRTIFGLQQRANAAFGFNMLDPNTVLDILNTNWSGQNYSDRLWANTEQLAESVKKQLLLGLLTGKTTHQMTQDIQAEFASGAMKTRRLMRTESTYVMNAVNKEAYKNTGVEWYIYVAILDLRTSLICRSLDKKRFLLANARAGDNYPPMHPWCRSTTIAWMPDALLKRLRQRAIDPQTGERITVAGDMDYDTWYRQYVIGAGPYGKGAIIDNDLICKYDHNGNYVVDLKELQSRIDTLSAEFGQTKHAKAWINYNGSTKGNDYRAAAEWLNNKTGYDGLPQRWDDNDKTAIRALRGVGGNNRRAAIGAGLKPLDMAEQFKRGDLFAGTGIYGDGTYCVESLDIAKMYAGREGAFYGIQIPADAKKADFWPMLQLRDTLKSNRLINDPYGLTRNVGRLAQLLGYDYIKAPNGDATGYPFYVILNRSAVRVHRK
jgi:SPP1 gp7 family putative phage head morphogenesis protein